MIGSLAMDGFPVITSSHHLSFVVMDPSQTSDTRYFFHHCPIVTWKKRKNENENEKNKVQQDYRRLMLIKCRETMVT